ncbi:uncharacterized protein LOC119575128 [Penaeus monodon]|uniref:uncharacterized protein LOC119575128 n=1 Tax=Penaeus monodon TaxID=6687 RepID=UPI0018A7A43B|nr:uncharacterized protein LOC119575128 [Penaeus monodon]
MKFALNDVSKNLKNCETSSGLSKQGQALRGVGASEKYTISGCLCKIATGYRDFTHCQDYLDICRLCYVMFPVPCYPGCNIPFTTTLILEAHFTCRFSACPHRENLPSLLPPSPCTTCFTI